MGEPNSTSSKLKGNSERTTDSQSLHSIEQKVQQSEAEYAVNVGSAQENNYFGTVTQYFGADSQANQEKPPRSTAKSILSQLVKG